MRIVRKSSPWLKGRRKWWATATLTLLLFLCLLVASVVFPPIRDLELATLSFTVFISRLMIEVAWHAFETGQFPWRRPVATWSPGGSDVTRWDTGRGNRRAYLPGVGVVVIHAGALILWALHRDGLFTLSVGLGLGVLAAIGVALLVLAFQRPNTMVLDDDVLILSGRDSLAIPLSDIQEIVLRPRSDPFAATLRRLPPEQDIVLELGRVSLDPVIFAEQMRLRAPHIEISDSSPGAFTPGMGLAAVTDGEVLPPRP